MGGENITDDKSGDIDSFRWGSMPRKEQEYVCND